MLIRIDDVLYMVLLIGDLIMMIGAVASRVTFQVGVLLRWLMMS